MFKPTDEQKKIIDHFDGHAIVIAGPGSGKTVTLLAHVKKLVQEREIPSDKIWIMAFNRDISAKLGDKIRSELGTAAPQTTTIHAFILRQIHENGKDLLANLKIADDLGECGKENLLWRPISKRLKQIHGIEKTSDGRRLDIRHLKGELWQQLTDYWLTSHSLEDPLFEKFKYEVERMKGIYEIVFLDELALKFLDALTANPSFRRSVAKPRIIIDEFQDLNPTEHKILFQLHQEGTTFLVVGDDDQAVNDFRHAHADYVREFVHTLNPKEFPLPRDRRCPKEILELADEFVKGLPRLEKKAGHASHKGRVDILAFSDDEKEKAGVVELVRKYQSVIPSSSDNPQILILAGNVGAITGSSRIAEILGSLRKNGIENVTGEQREDPLDNEWGLAFKSLLKILVDGISSANLASWLSVTDTRLMKIVNEHIIDQERKGISLGFQQAVMDLAKYQSKVKELLNKLDELKEQSANDDFDPGIIMNMIPQKLEGRNEGEIFINNLWDKARNESNVVVLSGFQEQQKGGQKPLQLLAKYLTEVKAPETGTVHVTTYRKAKGLEADLVIVTSVDSSDFFDNQQKRRLLYVAATRAKKNLVLTFAEKRTKARRFTRGKDRQSKGNPQAFRSPLIPNNYRTQQYSEIWVSSWEPV